MFLHYYFFFFIRVEPTELETESGLGSILFLNHIPKSQYQILTSEDQKVLSSTHVLIENTIQSCLF